MPSGRSRSTAIYTFWFPALLMAMSPAPQAMAQQGAGATSDSVSGLGRIEPEHGIVRLGVPSTPQAISFSVIRRLHVDVGDDVSEGQLLAETDSTDALQAEVRVAEAELTLAQHESEAAVGEEEEVCSRADVAQRTSARRADLLRKGVTSDEEADVAQGDARSLSGSCAAARIATRAAVAGVDVARASLDKARIEVERSVIRAPFSGRVLEIGTRPGELVGIDGVLELANVRRMYAIAEIYETDVRRVRPKQKATVTSPALEGPLTGVVEVVRLKVRKQDTTGTDPAARKDARIVEVEVLLDNPETVASLTNLQVEVLIHP